MDRLSLERRETLDVRTRPNGLREHLALLSQTISIRHEGRQLRVPNSICRRQSGPVRIDRASFLEKINGDLGRVDDDQRLAEERDGNYVSCERISSSLTSRKLLALTPTLAPLPERLPGTISRARHVEQVAQDRQGPRSRG